jgi:hypothetical protein
LRFIGKTVHGIYNDTDDDCEGLDVAIIDQLYGTHGKKTLRPEGQTGAGQGADDIDNEQLDDSASVGEDSPEELRESLGELAARIALRIKDNIRHDPVRVARHSTPFLNDEIEALFQETLNRVKSEGVIPSHYGICEDEWEDGYPPYEILQTGRQGQRELRISLPDDVWRP